MHLSYPNDLIAGIISAFRYLICTHPYYAENDWHGAQLLLDNPQGDWVEMRGPNNHTGYIYRGEGGGRYTRNKPTNIPDEQITRVQISSGPFVEIRQFLGQTISQIDETVTSMPIRKERFNKKLSLMYSMTKLDFEALEVIQLLTIFSSISNNNNADVLSALTNYLDTLKERHIDFTFPGSLRARILVLHALLTVSNTPAAFINSITSRYVAGHLKESWLIYSIVKVLLEDILKLDNGFELIEEVLEGLEVLGENEHIQAREAKSVGYFYGHMFESCPYFFGVWELYRYLYESVPLLEVQKERCRIRKNATEELYLRGFDAMRADFSNNFQDGYMLRNHRQLIEQTRATQGDFAAEQLANEKIQLAMLYPPFWKSFLIGETNILLSRIPV